MTRLLSSLLVSSLCALAACAGASSGDEGAAGGDAITESGVGPGLSCGGVTGLACAPGLLCHTIGTPGVGTCEEDPDAAPEGGTCGGAQSVACKYGADLTCKKPPGASASATGTCTGVTGASCSAVPACDPGQQTISGPEKCTTTAAAACYKRTLCGHTIWCTGDSGQTPSTHAGSDSPGADKGQSCGVGFVSTIQCRAPYACSTRVGIGICQ